MHSDWPFCQIVYVNIIETNIELCLGSCYITLRNSRENYRDEYCQPTNQKKN